MRYQEARPKIRTGDVIAWTHKPFNSWYDLQVQAVRFFTRSEYSHIGIALAIGCRLFVLEAVSAGVRIMPLSHDLPFFWIPVAGDFNDEVIELAFEKLGDKYSKIEAIKAFFVKLKPGDNNVWECAEYACYILNKAGIAIDCKCTPSEVVGWLQEKYGSILIPVSLD